MFLNRWKRAATIAPFVLVGLAQAEVTFQVTDLYTSKNGAPYAPMVGEIYSLTAKWKMFGGPAKQSYNIIFRMANRDVMFEITDLNRTEWTTTADFNIPLDGLIPIEVEVDPFGFANGADKTKSKIPIQIPDPFGGGTARKTGISVSSGGLKVVGVRIKRGAFTPRGPSKAIEYYSPRYALGAMSQIFDFKPGGTVTRMALMMGTPVTDSWQKQLHDASTLETGLGDSDVGTTPVENATIYPVHYWDKNNVPAKKVTFLQQYVLELKNQRVNKEMLDKVTWAQIDALKGINVFKFYTQPEEVIQSNSDKVKNFVASTLGSNYRSKYKPYEAARKLFQATLKHVMYFYPKEGQPDLRPDNAIGMIDKKIGDCGGFSIMLVALYRNVGIPARTACGAWLGQDAGHCWCEMWMPGAGWVISDGSAGNSLAEDGSYAYYFGNIPDLNSRFAMMRGNTFNVKDIKTSWLQGPLYPWIWGTAKINNYDAHSALVEITKNQSDDFGGQSFGSSRQKSQAFQSLFHSVPMPELPAAAKRCPCHNYGGLRLKPAQRLMIPVKPPGKA